MSGTPLKRLRRPSFNNIFAYNSRWLAEPDDGAEDNYWIVNQLMQRLPNEEAGGEELQGPHYDDQWWIGAKSYVG